MRGECGAYFMIHNFFMPIPTINELIQTGAQYGHGKTRVHPKFKPFIDGLKNNIYTINLEKTIERILQAIPILKEIRAKKGLILFVGTKPVAKSIARNYAKQMEMPSVTGRWLVGTLTNFDTIKKLIIKFKSMKRENEGGEWEKYTKKERLMKMREMTRIEKKISGMETLEKMPDILFIIDTHRESTALREAKRMKIKIAGIVDADGNPDEIDYPIPANDESRKTIELILKTIAEETKP